MARETESPGPAVTAQQLRADIDSGLTWDKVPASDPAAAPLGTDDEAAGGAPEQKQSIARAIDSEVKGQALSGADRSRIGAAWVLIAFVGVLATGILVWAAANGFWR